MSSKKYLSDKKITRMTITTSPALKDWIERYIKKELKKNPSDERLKSLSSFCHETLECVMKIYEKGKNLDDFRRLINYDVKHFFDELSTNVHLPFLEAYAKPSTYIEIDYKKLMRLLILSKQFYTKDLNPYDINSFYRSFDRIKDRYLEMGITKSLDLEISPIKDSKHLHCILEHVGLAKSGFPVNNIHIANCKIILQMMGFLGFKVINLEPSFHELYYRIEMVTTNLYFQKKLLKKERLTLVENNVKYLTNYSRIVEDDDYQLWMKLANSHSCIVEFKSDKAFEEWISIVEKDLEFFDKDQKSKIKILKFFEKIHWIHLDENHKSFTFQLSIGLSTETTTRLINYIDKNFQYDKDGNTFFIFKI
jgi:hypothetical protein